ncbi:MAG: HNH endonuclease [Acidimicrobiia bacterium]|nr:HNH endonuclease [Acidimicrobiia bacterium]NNF09226.1 HNH endonuclease [Acidimicrobiia bacterium]NNL71130.1 HNH endonuclease [Acidimicrobiia bacterium]
MRRLILNRDGGCTIDGCHSSYRLEIHHIVPRSEGGTHDLANLTTLCWWHHHNAVHGAGAAINPDTPPHRRTIIPAGDPP